MPWQPVPLAVKSSEVRSGVVSIERLTNLYAEKSPENAKSQISLYGTPGLKSWTTIGSGPCRGVIYMNNRIYVVTGSELYSIDWQKNTKLIGSVGGNGNVRMTENGTHIGIATSGPAYAANESEIIALPEQGLNGATYQDGYGIFTQQGTQFFWITGVDDMTTIGGTDFSSADRLSDYVTGCISDHGQVYLFKERSTEVWWNSGNAAFPFERTPEGFFEVGCVASGSIAKAGNSVLWLGRDEAGGIAVYATSGGPPEKISTHAIDKALASVNSPSSASGFVYRQEGHTFYILGFSDMCVSYNMSTGLWNHLETDGLGGRWRGNGHAFAFDKNLVGDYSGNTIYELDLDTYTDNAGTLAREIITPPIDSDTFISVMHQFRIDMEPGTGIATGQGSDPQIMLQWTDDAGASWSNEQWIGIGAVGERKWRALFSSMGQFRNRSIKLRISDPVKVAFLSPAYASIERRAQ